MGIVSNRHTAFHPSLRAEAERIAQVKVRAMARIIDASADFDSGGESYWKGNLEQFGRFVDSALQKLTTSREELRQNIYDSFSFEEEHRKSKKLLKAYELNLNHGAYKPEEFLTKDVNMSSRVLTGLDAILASRDRIVDAAKTGDLQTVYALVSNPGREVTEAAAEAVTQTVHDSRITHETSNIVELMWEKEGIVDDKAAHLQETGDTTTIPQL